MQTQDAEETGDTDEEEGHIPSWESRRRDCSRLSENLREAVGRRGKDEGGESSQVVAIDGNVLSS